MDVLERLNTLLQARGWTRYRLSKESGLTESTLANIFQRNAMPSLDTLERICNGFGITLSQFFAEGKMVELTPELSEVFENWRTLTPSRKRPCLFCSIPSTMTKNEEEAVRLLPHLYEWIMIALTADKNTSWRPAKTEHIKKTAIASRLLSYIRRIRI